MADAIFETNEILLYKDNVWHSLRDNKIYANNGWQNMGAGSGVFNEDNHTWYVLSTLYNNVLIDVPLNSSATSSREDTTGNYDFIVNGNTPTFDSSKGMYLFSPTAGFEWNSSASYYLDEAYSLEFNFNIVNTGSINFGSLLAGNAAGIGLNVVYNNGYIGIQGLNGDLNFYPVSLNTTYNFRLYHVPSETSFIVYLNGKEVFNHLYGAEEWLAASFAFGNNTFSDNHLTYYASGLIIRTNTAI